jgi:hypothetical protein
MLILCFRRTPCQRIAGSRTGQPKGAISAKYPRQAV